jgi:hypothetical protein
VEEADLAVMVFLVGLAAVVMVFQMEDLAEVHPHLDKASLAVMEVLMMRPGLTQVVAVVLER